MANLKPGPGESIREEKTTTVIPASAAPVTGKNKTPFWEFLDSLSTQQWAEREVEITLYRMEGPRRVWCEKFLEPPFSHEVVKKKFGGGVFNAMTKVDKQLSYNVDFEIAGLPKEPDEITAAASTSSGSSDIAQLVALMREQNQSLLAELREARGSGIQNEAAKQALALNSQMFSGAASAIANTAQSIANGGVSHTPSPMDEFMRQFMSAAMTRLLAPPEESGLKKTLEMIQLLKDNGLVGGAAPKADMATTLVSMAPQILSKITEGMSAMAKMRETELQAIMLQRGNRALPPGAPQPGPQAVPNPRPEIVRHEAPPPVHVIPPPQQEQNAGLGFMEFLQGGIVNVLSDPEKPLEDAAHECLIFLDSSGAAQFVDQMIEAGPEQLLELFKTQPILQQVPQNPRLTEFIAKFLQLAKESRTQPPQMEPPPAS